MGPNLRVAPAHLPDSLRVRMQRLYPGAKLMSGGEALVVPMPRSGNDALPDDELIAWTGQLLTALFPEPAPEGVPAGSPATSEAAASS